MSDVTINPITALLRSRPGLPLTLSALLLRLCDPSRGSNNYAMILSEADLTQSPLKYDIEMVENLRAPWMQAYAEARLTGEAIVPACVLAGLYKTLMSMKAERTRVFHLDTVVTLALRATLRLGTELSGWHDCLLIGYCLLYEDVRRSDALDNQARMERKDFAEDFSRRFVGYGSDPVGHQSRKSRKEFIEDFSKRFGGNGDSLNSKLAPVLAGKAIEIDALLADYQDAVDGLTEPVINHSTSHATAIAKMARGGQMTLRWADDETLGGGKPPDVGASTAPPSSGR